VPPQAPNAARDLGSLTAKPVLFAANVDEGGEEVPRAAKPAAQGDARHRLARPRQQQLGGVDPGRPDLGGRRAPQLAREFQLQRSPRDGQLADEVRHADVVAHVQADEPHGSGNIRIPAALSEHQRRAAQHFAREPVGVRANDPDPLWPPHPSVLRLAGERGAV